MPSPANVTRRLLAPLCLLAVLSTGAGAADPPPAQFTAVAVSVVFPPRPVAGSDGKSHLAYELSVVNMTSLVVRLDRIEAIDGDTGETLSSWSGGELDGIVRLNGHDPAPSLGPAQSALVFLDVQLPTGRTAPATVSHRITTTRQMKAEGSDLHKGVPLPAGAGIPADATFLTARVAVDTQPAVRLAPPLRGPGWIVVNGCCATITSHRGAAMPFDGVVQVPERFAIDFIQLDRTGRVFEGAADKTASYPYFGATVHAAAPGTVVGIVDGMPEQVPGAARNGITTDNAAGNHVVVDMGSGNFALYAHLKTGSVSVKPGDRVAQGQVVGMLGNTGNSDAPHLHFHVMNGPSPLASQGLPYVFDGFTGRGRADLDDPAAMTGGAVKIDATRASGARRDALPLDSEVVDFTP